MDRVINEILESERLYLKKHSINNAQTMFDIIQTDRDTLSKFLPWVHNTKTVDDSKTFIQITHQLWKTNKAYEFAIYLKNSKQYIGNIGAINLDFENRNSEIGYWLWSKFCGQGYMSEALRTLEQHLFNLDFFRIEIRCESKNQKSQAVALNNSYALDGILRSNCIINDKRRDSLVYSKLKTD